MKSRQRPSGSSWIGKIARIGSLLFLGTGSLLAQTNALPPLVPAAPASYLLSPSDVVLVKVYQEDDLETRMRIGKDGTCSFPLIGVVPLGGKSVEEASKVLRDRLAKDYLVNPQVTLTVVEYAKRRFTVLGQVQKPGAFEIPNEESVTFLQAIAMAGGFTRLANRSRITVTRVAGGQKTTLNVDANVVTHQANLKPFEILPDDTITVGERIF